jgi:sigma-E factor negative regulatory protein RseA
MTDRFQEQISGFVDDELSADECEFFVRRLQRDSESRRQLMRYHLIGAALRGELTHSDPDTLRRRLQGALSGAREAPSRNRWRFRAYLRPALGVAVAAAVAAVAVVALQTVNLSAPADFDGASNAVLAGERTEPEAYVVPPDTTERRLVSPPIQLTNYLMRHSEYASHLSRTSVHSNVVATGQPDMTDEDADVRP